MHNAFILPLEYIKWHYTRGIRDYIQVATLLERFVFHFFSIRLLLNTFWMPFERLGESYMHRFSFSAFVETWIVNSIMRCVGVLMRAVTIALGLLSALILALVLLIGSIIWLALPLLIPILFLRGINLILS